MPFPVKMTDLAERLLREQPESLQACAPLNLKVVRHNASQYTVAAKHGDVLFHLRKPKPFNPFVGLDWQLSDGINGSTPAVRVKKALLSSSTTFETVYGVSLTTLTQPFYKPYCEFSWEGGLYRWETKGCVVPLQLQLCSVATGQHVASLEGSVSMPWSKIQQHITILAGQDDPVWLQVVIASGLAEAKRLGGENSSTTPRRFAQ